MVDGVAAAAGAMYLVLRRRETAVRLARAVAARLRIGDPVTAQRLVESVGARLDAFSGDRRFRVTVIGWASANLLLDAAALWVFVRAFGPPAPVGALVLGYGLAGVLALLPLTPGGLGFVEATLGSVLIASGTPHAQAVIGVLAWRLAEFWLPIPAGAACYVTLRVGRRRRREPVAS